MSNRVWGSHVYYESVAVFDRTVRDKAGDAWYGGRPMTLTKFGLPDWRAGMDGAPVKHAGLLGTVFAERCPSFIHAYEGVSVTESPLAILKAAECDPDTPALERLPEHHDLVAKSVQLVHREGRRLGGQLGSRRGARFRTYERLRGHIEAHPLFATDAVTRTLQALYTYPLTESATDTLNRQLRAGLEDDALSDLIVALHDDERLVVAHDGDPDAEPRIICSLGLAHA